MASDDCSRRTARHQILQELERRILAGEIRPGERLSQQSLARELGVAQGTIRESLLELQWHGLVESIDHLGVFVGRLDVDRIAEAYELREVLEGLAARRACQNAGRADIAELKAMADRILQLAQGDDAETAAHDRCFHLRIVEISRNGTLLRLAETYRALGTTLPSGREPAVIHAEHLRIVDAIEHNFPEEAERQARAHVAGTRERIRSLAREGRLVPGWARGGLPA